MVHIQILKRAGILQRGLCLGVASLFAGVIVMAAKPPAEVFASGGNQYLQNAVEAIVGGGFPGAWAADLNGSTGAAGVADIQTGRAIQANQNLRIGSLTKSFVGAVALQLVAEHKLHLNDTVEEWLPGLLPYGDQVTVRNVLQHTSGIPDYLETGANPLIVNFINDPSYRSLTWTSQQIVDLVSAEPLNFVPGSQAEYSDTNYIVVGMIVEAVTQHSPQSEVQHRIIEPLHLTHTYFPVTSSTMPAPFARGYSYPTDNALNPILTEPLVDFTEYNPSLFGTTGAMISNPADLNTFYSALLGGQLLPFWLTAEMKRTVPLHQENFPEGFGMGLGIWSWDLSQTIPGCNKTIYGHEGEAAGYDAWAFGNYSGSKVISMGVNLLVPDWDAYYNVELPQYANLWCQ